MNKFKTIGTLLLTVIITLPGFAATRPQDDKDAHQSDLDIQTLKQLRGKIFELKYREPNVLLSTLRPLGSGYKGATMMSDNDLHVITVRDFPENLAAIEEAIKRLDVPQTIKPKANLEVQISLIAASRIAGPNSDIPTQISAVLEQLRNTMRYKNYRYITTFINRTSDGGTVHATGAADAFFQVAETKGKQTFYDYLLNDIRLVKTEGTEGGDQVIQVRDFRFTTKVPFVASTTSGGGSTISYQDMSIQTGLTMKDGEIIVVGTSNVGSSDEALIVIVSIKKV